MGELPDGGAMLAVQASEQEAMEVLVGYQDRVASLALAHQAAHDVARASSVAAATADARRLVVPT